MICHIARSLTQGTNYVRYPGPDQRSNFYVHHSTGTAYSFSKTKNPAQIFSIATTSIDRKVVNINTDGYDSVAHAHVLEGDNLAVITEKIGFLTKFQL